MGSGGRSRLGGRYHCIGEKIVADSKAFVSELMQQILSGRNIPKLQVERHVSPIIGMFLPEVLTETLNGPHTEGRWYYRMLCPEFPIKKEKGSNQSTNVDWLMYREFIPDGASTVESVELVFLELKTTNTSYSKTQQNIYAKTSRRIEDEGNGALFLFCDIAMSIRKHSKEPRKYKHVMNLLRRRFPGGLHGLRRCSKAQIIYLMPGTTKSAGFDISIPTGVDEVLCFGQLKNGPSVPFQEEWEVIRDLLKNLDDPLV